MWSTRSIESDEYDFDQGMWEKGGSSRLEVMVVVVVKCEAGYDVMLYEDGWAPVIKDSLQRGPC
jgi:hypothetical protein